VTELAADPAGNEFTALVAADPSTSPSPQVHEFVFRKAGIKAIYVPLGVAKRALPSVVRDLMHRSRGFNVTIPYKEAVIPMLDSLSAEAEAAGAVNTVFGTKGYNTDYAAVKRLLLDRGVGNEAAEEETRPGENGVWQAGAKKIGMELGTDMGIDTGKGTDTSMITDMGMDLELNVRAHNLARKELGSAPSSPGFEDQGTSEGMRRARGKGNGGESPGAIRETALVLGSGGAAKAALLALCELGYRCFVYDRNPARARSASQRFSRFGCSAIEGPSELARLVREGVEIAVNATPVFWDLPSNPRVYVDFSYHRRAALGSEVNIGGDEILVRQAMMADRIWFGNAVEAVKEEEVLEYARKFIRRVHKGHDLR